MPVPECLDWYVWKLVMTHTATYAELRDRWTVGEMAQAHLALDITEDLDARLHEVSR